MFAAHGSENGDSGRRAGAYFHFIDMFATHGREHRDNAEQTKERGGARAETDVRLRSRRK
jgi:hypothetical protein